MNAAGQPFLLRHHKVVVSVLTGAVLVLGAVAAADDPEASGPTRVEEFEFEEVPEFELSPPPEVEIPPPPGIEPVPPPPPPPEFESPTDPFPEP